MATQNTNTPPTHTAVDDSNTPCTAFIGLDAGNLNVDGTAMYGTRVASWRFQATTGGVPENTENDSGQVARLIVEQPHHLSVGYTAVKESPTGKVHDISRERYYGAKRDGDAPRELSPYYEGLVYFGVGTALAKTGAVSAETIPVMLTLTVPQNHYSARLERDLVTGFSGQHTIKIAGQEAVTVSMTVAIKSQPFCAMVSQYGTVTDGKIMVRDSAWFESSCGVIDVGSRSFQVARFEPQPDSTGNMLITCTDHLCTDGGVWSLIQRLKQKINESQYGEIFSLDESQLMRVMETGRHNTVSLADLRQQVIDEKVPELIADARKVLGSGEDFRKIVLVGRGNEGIAQVFVDAFAGTSTYTGLQVHVSVDDHGNTNPGTAIADGAFKYSLVQG